MSIGKPFDPQPAVAKRILSDLEDSLSIRTIAAKLGVTHDTLRLWLKREGIKP